MDFVIYLTYPAVIDGTLVYFSVQPKQLIGGMFWDYIIGLHVLQFLLFLSLWLPDIVFLVGRLKVWLVGGKSVRVDDSYKVFNLDCDV
jgi:L-gulonolactone oxidase